MAAFTSASDARRELADILTAFLETALHALLYARRVYPPSIFEQRSVYDCVSWMSRSPELNACISELLGSVHALLLAGSVEALTVAFLPSAEECGEVDGSGGVENRALESYRFAVSIDASVAPSARATYADLNASFAAALMRLQALETSAPLPPGATWTVLLHTHEVEREGLAGLGPPTFPGASYSQWARVDPADTPVGAFCATSDAVLPYRYATPLKTIRAFSLTCDIFRETRS